MEKRCRPLGAPPEALSEKLSDPLYGGAEIWGGDERGKFQFSESSGSLNVPDLFAELPFL